MGNLDALNGGKPIHTDEENTGGDFEPMPAGWYPFEIKKEEIRDTKDKKGKYLWIEIDVIGPHYNGRKIFHRFNLQNQNAKAQEIGQRELAFLGQSVGLPHLSDSKELLGKQFDGRLVVRPAEGDYGPDNELKGFAPLGTKSANQPAPAKAAGKTAAAGGRAWDKPQQTAQQASSAPTSPSQPANTSAAPSSAPATAAAPNPTPAKRPWER